MASRIPYYEIFFNNVPKDQYDGYCCMRVRMTEYRLREYIPSPYPTLGWNEHTFYVGRRAYRAIAQWADFLGRQPNYYANGEISTYTYNLDYSKFETLMGICMKEMHQK